MNVKYYACFVVQNHNTNLGRELGSIVEIDDDVGASMDHDDVAQMLAENLDIKQSTLNVYHWSRVH
ncbi:MAG: hypothetical protein AB8G16_12940 [Gammaproteobacteria bacterium]